MSRKKQDTTVRRFMRSRLFLILLLVLLAIVALGYARAYHRNYTVQKEIEDLQREVARLETKKLESLEILEYVTSDRFIEDTARKELNMKRPGEKVIHLTGTDYGHSIEDTGNEEDRGGELGNPKKWWYYFTQHKLPSDA